uniref:Uncharacterized protein n=1 Tax=Bionectria ochroleuca TaxID=29856 RepID=A0A8H7NEP2_BIOOC
MGDSLELGLETWRAYMQMSSSALPPMNQGIRSFWAGRAYASWLSKCPNQNARSSANRAGVTACLIEAMAPGGALEFRRLWIAGKWLRSGRLAETSLARGLPSSGEMVSGRAVFENSNILARSSRLHQ